MADLRIAYSELMVGANHPTKTDTLNRLILAEHGSDGKHSKITDPWIDVRAFGAKGDNSTDDTTAIQNAFNALPSTGGWIYFPSGIYLVSSTITIPQSAVTVTGNGQSSVLRAKASTYAPPVMFSATSKNNLIFARLRFEGNGSLPSGTPGTADPAIYLTSVNNAIFEECYMTNFMGIGLALAWCTDIWVEKNKFVSMGQYMQGLSPITGVPNIWAAYNSSRIYVRHNYFYDARFGAIELLCSLSEFSHNYIEHSGESAVYTEYVSGTDPVEKNIISHNIIKDVYLIDIAPIGIECSANNTTIANNNISLCQGDGIGIGAASKVIVVNNISFNNNQTPAQGLIGCGIKLQNVSTVANPDKGNDIVIKGNICYDDQVTPTQQYGVRVYMAGSAVSYKRLMIEGNAAYGNVLADIYTRPDMNLLSDPSVSIRDNQPWVNIYKNTTRYTHNVASTVQMMSYTVPANSMGYNGGVRIIAYGTVTGTANTKTITVRFSTTLTFMTITFAAGDTGTWRAEAQVMNSGANNTQAISGVDYKNNAVNEVVATTGAIDTTADRAISIQGQLVSVLDSITCDALIIERL